MLAATKMTKRSIQGELILCAQDDIEGEEDPAPGHTLSKCATAAGPSFARKDSKQRAKVIQPCSVAVEHKIEGRQQRTKLMAGPRVVVARPAKLAADRGLTQPKPELYIYITSYRNIHRNIHRNNHLQLLQLVKWQPFS